MKLDFSCDGNVVGCFLDLVAYPRAAGTYRYMPYRGPGHLLLQETLHRLGVARCTYGTQTEQGSFRARTGTKMGTLQIDDIEESPRLA